MKKILLSEKKDNYVECRLCPNRCQLKENEIGKCSVRKSDGDTIFLMNYGELVSVAVNPIEKKPFRKYLPGTKTLSIGGWGCSLDCIFCQNYKISQSEGSDHPKFFPTEYLISVAKEKKCQSICMTFNEPTISFEYLIDLAKACHKSDLRFILKTNAYVNKEPWNAICEVVNAINIDIKSMVSANFKKITRCDFFMLGDRIKEAYEMGVHLEVSIPLYCDDALCEEVKNMGIFLSSLDVNIPCHLLKIVPSYRNRDFISDSKSIDKAEVILSGYMNYIYRVD